MRGTTPARSLRLACRVAIAYAQCTRWCRRRPLPDARMPVCAGSTKGVPMAESRLKMLQGTPILGGVRDDIMEFLLSHVRNITLKEGEFLFVEDDPCDAMYVLETGQVAILKRWKGIYYRLNYLDAGDSIGEMSLMDFGRRSASVLAMTDCTAIELNNDAIMKLYERDLEQFAMIQMNISRELSRRLRVADESLFRELIRAEQIPQH
jgi:CRP-like cAMP-binding protein